MNNPYIYLRGLRHADHTVFNVEKGQKTYYDSQFGRHVAYASGQHVKRSVLEAITSNLEETPAAVTFYHGMKVDKGKITVDEGEVTSPADPHFAEQLLGGWMIAKTGGQSRTLKRRSPLSISAMRTLHPLLGNNAKEDITFDRSDRPDVHNVVVRDKDGRELGADEIKEVLKGTDRSLLRKWIPDQSRAGGLFVYDVAIDLRTLFSVSTNATEPELTTQTMEALKGDGWVESVNTFGACLVAPQTRREQLIPIIAKALLNWRITTNQARTYSPMEILAVAISQDANKISGAIRAKLNTEGEKMRATPIVDDSIPDVDTFITLAAGGYLSTQSESVDALGLAEQKIIELLSSYPYEERIA